MCVMHKHLRGNKNKKHTMLGNMCIGVKGKGEEGRGGGEGGGCRFVGVSDLLVFPYILLLVVSYTKIFDVLD